MFGQRAGEGGDPRPPADEIISLRVKREGPDHSLLTSSTHPLTITTLTCHPPQLDTSTLSQLKHAQSDLHLYHMSRKQDKQPLQNSVHLQVTLCISVIC